MLDDNIRTAIVDYIDDHAELKDRSKLEDIAEGLVDYLAKRGFVVIDKIFLDRLIDKQK